MYHVVESALTLPLALGMTLVSIQMQIAAYGTLHDRARTEAHFARARSESRVIYTVLDKDGGRSPSSSAEMIHLHRDLAEDLVTLLWPGEDGDPDA